MKAPVNPFFLLFGLVLTIYVMRHGDISVGSTVKRILQEYRPSASLCKGTSLDQVYSQSEIERAESFKKSLQGMRGGNPMKDLLLYKPFEAQSFLDYFMGALAFIVPWAVMFILSLLSAIVITCNWCCIYGCCKKAKCCKCCKEPKDSSKKRIYVFISAIFALAGVGSGIAGIVMSSGVPKGIELTMCSVIAIVEDLTYGLPSDHWLGVEGALNAIVDLQQNFTTVKNKLSASSASTSPALTAKNDVSTQLSNMITALDINGNKNFQRPDPSETTYTPLNITNIGPKTSSYTMTGLIETEVDVYYQVVKTAQDSIDSAINTIKTGNIEPMIEEGREDVAEFANTFQDALKSVNDFGSIGKSAITGIGAGLTAIFAATLVFSIFAVGAMIMVGLCKMKSFNKFLHSSWMGFTIMSIFGFLLSTILYPLSLVLMETCDVVQTALDDSDTMSQLMGNALDGNSAGEIIDLCLFRGGDVIAYFGLDSSLSSFKSINDQFSAVKAVMPLAKTAPVSKTLAYEYDLVDGMTSGKYLDLEPTIDMATLNSKTNHNPNTCTNIYDRWEGNSVNCTSDKGTLFESSSAATFNLGSPTCIGLDKWTATTRAATDRYGPPQSSFSSCGNTGAFTTENYVTTFVTNFQTNRVRVATLFSDVKNQLDLVQPKYNTFADKVKDVLSGLVDIQGDLESVNAALYDDNTGLFNNMKCSFIKTGLDRFVDSMCVGFISSLYQASVVIIICSVMSFFGAIFVFCLAKRFILEDPNTKPKPV